MPPLLILYGTETGNSQSIAERIHALAQTARAHPQANTPLVSPILLGRMDDYQSLGLLDSNNGRVTLIIVCSTTGNGDAPKSATGFVRFVKKRTHPENCLSHVSFVCLALGDTNYDKFCFIGKFVDQRLAALGATRLANVMCADDVAGLDNVVETFIQTSLGLVLGGAFSFGDALSSSVEKDGGEKKKALALNNSESTEIEKKKLDDENLGWLPSSSPIAKLSSLVSAHELAEKPLHPARLRPPISLIRLPSLPGSTTELSTKNNNTRIVSSHYLANHEDRIVFEMDVELDDLMVKETKTKVEPGDVLVLTLPNPKSIVQETCRLLGFNPDEVVEIEKKQLSICQVLENMVDLTSPPSKGFLRTLAEFTSNPEEKHELMLMTSSNGKHAYEEFVQKQRLTVMETIQAYPSTHGMPLESFLGGLAPLTGPQTRSYSIASSPLAANSTLKLVVGVLRAVKTPSGREIRGVYSNELERLCFSSSLTGNETQQQLNAVLRANSTFRLPADDTRPIIMIGPGTGIAPFIGFIEHRPLLRESRVASLRASVPATGLWRGGLDFEEDLERAALEEDLEALRPRSPLDANITNGTVSPPISRPLGEAWLYSGCRHEAKDFLFRDRLMAWSSSQVTTLHRLRVAFSRDQPEKVYVQHLLREDAMSIADKLLNQEAHVYVCGDGARMARDVQDALLDILTDHMPPHDARSNMDDRCVLAREYLDQMQRQGRFVQDIWFA